MVLCGQHIAENQGEIDAFKLTHQKYSNMKLYQLSSNLKKPVDLDLSEEREREGEGGCVPDVRHQATFTMQMVDDGKGRDILVLYDSRALTSGVKESVVRRLGSRVLRKGPIPLTVVGGGGPALVREGWKVLLSLWLMVEL